MYIEIELAEIPPERPDLKNPQSAYRGDEEFGWVERAEPFRTFFDRHDVPYVFSALYREFYVECSKDVVGRLEEEVRGHDRELSQEQYERRVERASGSVED